MVALTRLPSVMYSSTARILASYEYMNNLLVVQDFIRIPVAYVAETPQQESASS